MFDLEQEIRRWRCVMTAQMPMRREAVRELESHLRDAVQQLMQDGSVPRDAWAAALVRLGTPEVIAAEFGKLPAFAVWHWMPARVVLGALAAFVSLLGWIVGSHSLVGRGDALLALHVFAVTVGYMSLFAAGVIAAWCVISRVARGWSPLETKVLHATLRYVLGASFALTFIGVALGSVWAYDHLGRFWDWDPKEIGAATVLAWNGVVLGLLARGRSERWGILLGLMGSIVVALGWFGPALVPSGPLHDYTNSHAAVVYGLTALAVLQVVLIGLVFVSPGRLRFPRAE